MASSTIIRYSFGEDDKYFYEFKFHGYLVPGSANVITTVMMVHTNIRTDPPSSIDPYIPDLVQFIAKKCVEYNANYDGFHNFLIPYSLDESANIAQQVNAAIETLKLGK